MATTTGLRERHKQQTRQLIFEAASRLFAARGFDAVTVAEVAWAADVSEMTTVYNHFPTKEELFFGKMEFFEQRLLDAVRDRAAGVSALEAFRRPGVDGCSNLAVEETTERIAQGSGPHRREPPLCRCASGRSSAALRIIWQNCSPPRQARTWTTWSREPWPTR
jgi:AcrR family transcriptional regulator